MGPTLLVKAEWLSHVSTNVTVDGVLRFHTALRSFANMYALHGTMIIWLETYDDRLLTYVHDEFVHSHYSLLCVVYIIYYIISLLYLMALVLATSKLIVEIV